MLPDCGFATARAKAMATAASAALPPSCSTRKPICVACGEAVATASPHATQIGLRVLQDGGNAADAAVAIAFALAVAKPQSGNIGGGGFLVYYDAATRGVWTLDFREVAPAAAKSTTAKGAAAAAVPGTVAGLAALHERFGSRKWEGLLVPAID